jgi:hypothetical protein
LRDKAGVRVGGLAEQEFGPDGNDLSSWHGWIINLSENLKRVRVLNGFGEAASIQYAVLFIYHILKTVGAAVFLPSRTY